MPTANANGITLDYETFGKAGDSAVLLIMGFATQGIMWPDAFCEGLAEKGHYVIRYDNRDIGRSSRLDAAGTVDAADFMMKSMMGQPTPPAPYTLDDMAGDAVGLLDALKIRAAHIVGASMGGMIAQIVASKHGGRALSLTSIMSTTGKRDLPQAKPEAMAALVSPPTDTSREGLIQNAMKIWTTIGSPGYRATPEELRAMAERLVDRASYYPAGIARQLVAILASPPRNDILKAVKCPALVLHGADDPLIPVEGAQDTAASIPGAKLVVVPGMGHDFTQALVPVYLREVGGFIASVGAKGKAA